ncbi:hypothetical protein QE152_g11110 [Popillia japonica]|uniref:Uncharacterized protein n=1 Tax=Popillia japonica TaxID=7064 RepID=A0AAW1LMZ4_POPJA
MQQWDMLMREWRTTYPNARTSKSFKQLCMPLQLVCLSLTLRREDHRHNNPIEELQTVVYAAATSVLELNSQTRRPQTQQPATKKKTASWERRLTNKINTLREQIGRVTGAVRDTIKNERTRQKRKQRAGKGG